jgi:hypothetical protein
MQYLIGLLGIITGLLLIKYRAKVREFTGLIGFAEKYLGSGGTYTFYLLLGAALIFLSVLYATGQLQSFLANNFLRYF